MNELTIYGQMRDAQRRVVDVLGDPGVDVHVEFVVPGFAGQPYFAINLVGENAREGGVTVETGDTADIAATRLIMGIEETRLIRRMKEIRNG